MKYKAIIFDLDGTLLDSLVGIADAVDRLLERRGFPTHPLDSYKYFVGEGINTLVGRAMPEQWHREFKKKEDKEAAITALVKEFRLIYDETWPQKSPPYPGIPELLEELETIKIKMAVLSNKSDDFTKRMVSKLLPYHHFDPVFGTRPGVPVKPDPAAAREIAAILAAQPRDILFLGDSGVDMQTAANAGMYPVGALWGFREAAELRNYGAEKLIGHPLELTTIIK